MFYKLSNIADRQTIEQTVSAVFKFPNIYKPKYIINGTEEHVLPILTAEDTTYIKFAIWGMLPTYFTGDWKPYQHTKNTLNITCDALKNHLMFYRNSQVKRCLIPVTGFIEDVNDEGELKSYYVSRPRSKPFCIAGIYNQLEDGFYTVSLLVGPSKKSTAKFQPLILNPDLQQDWLNSNCDTLNALELLKKPHSYMLNRVPISSIHVLNNDINDLEAELGLENAV
ncbi:SOS response-associated peptidase family protein [Formosa haliotis]|uniref:SOS response-associated peptidase family protein n=1 Tax=Formosa haliotis TaxID=1555194 RepID=UPI0008243D3C|nr:SOS response-associated peptidase family protein [Formosa haliotis]